MVKTLHPTLAHYAMTTLVKGGSCHQRRYQIQEVEVRSLGEQGTLSRLLVEISPEELLAVDPV